MGFFGNASGSSCGVVFWEGFRGSPGRPISGFSGRGLWSARGRFSTTIRGRIPTTIRGRIPTTKKFKNDFFLWLGQIFFSATWKKAWSKNDHRDISPAGPECEPARNLGARGRFSTTICGRFSTTDFGRFWIQKSILVKKRDPAGFRLVAPQPLSQRRSGGSRGGALKRVYRTPQKLSF